MGGAILRDVVQDYTKQQGKKATESNPISSIVSTTFASAPASRVLP